MYFEDYYSVFLKKGRLIQTFSLESLFEQVFYSGRVQSEIGKIQGSEIQKKELVDRYLNDFRSSRNKRTTQAIFLMLHKLARKNFE